MNGINYTIMRSIYWTFTTNVKLEEANTSETLVTKYQAIQCIKVKVKVKHSRNRACRPRGV